MQLIGRSIVDVNVHGNFHPVEINNTHDYVPKLLLLSE